jgi:hypothetical protein
MQTRPTPQETKRGRTVATVFLRHVFTPTPAISARIAEIVAFLADKDLPTWQRGRLADCQRRADLLAEADALEIAAPFYRQACRDLIEQLAESGRTADRAYARFAAERIGQDLPAELRARFRQLTVQRDRGSRGRSAFVLDENAAGDL